MTDALSDAPLDDDERDDEDHSDEVVEPVPDVDPVTVRNDDPGAMSEYERNQRLSEAYEV